MIILNLTVYAELRQEKFVRALKNAFEPENVLLRFSDRTDGSVTEFPEKRAHMVITDSYDRIEQLRKMPSHNLRYIFIGTMKLTDDIEDVWDTDNPAEITARFERVLQRSSAQAYAWFYEHALYTTIDTVPDMLWFKQRDGIHTMVNNAFAEAAHKKREDIIGHDIFNIWDTHRPVEPASSALSESEDAAIVTHRTIVRKEPLMTRDGMKQFTTYKTALSDMFGNVFGTVGVAHDSTNFSNLDAALDTIVESIPLPMVIFDADMRVLKMNDAFLNISGIAPDKAVSFSYENWKAETLTPAGEEEINSYKHSVSCEYILHADEDERIFRVAMQEFHDCFDSISGYLLTMEDLTYQRAYEKIIKEKQKKEEE